MPLALRFPTPWATTRANKFAYAAALLFALVLSSCGGGGEDASANAPVANANANTALQTSRVRLGQQIFSDVNLSEPRGTACVACHQANRGFAGNHGSVIGVARGSLPGAVGLRNAMTNSYMGFIPTFSFETANGETEAVGGHFWDGRADTLALQALGPLLNPLEMNNSSRQAVVNKIAGSSYAALFRQEFGANIFNDTDAAFTQIGVAIAAFELASLQPFSSKYDAMVRGQTTLSAPEARGMALFMDPTRANCAGCHLMNPNSGNPADSIFSEFTYYATGIPRNAAIPKNSDPSFFDLGLCGPDRTPPTVPNTVAPGVTIDNFCGKFRMPTLRNVAERPAYMHNGVFNSLSAVVRFYATRNSNPQAWYGAAGVANDVPARYLANIEVTKAPFNQAPAAGAVLTEAEIADIVSFLHTLSDGFSQP